MVSNPPEGCQRIIPYLTYRDAPAALEYLCKSFGFEERFRLPGPDGTLMHAEIGYQDNIVMLATTPGGGAADDSAARPCLIVCYVDDVDAHHDRAKAAGAKIVAPPEDQFYGDRTYRATDPEGHSWFFHTHVRDVPAEEMKPPGA